jgi:hypothetical protein
MCQVYTVGQALLPSHRQHELCTYDPPATTTPRPVLCHTWRELFDLQFDGMAAAREWNFAGVLASRFLRGEGVFSAELLLRGVDAAGYVLGSVESTSSAPVKTWLFLLIGNRHFSAPSTDLLATSRMTGRRRSLSFCLARPVHDFAFWTWTGTRLDTPRHCAPSWVKVKIRVRVLPLGTAECVPSAHLETRDGGYPCSLVRAA